MHTVMDAESLGHISIIRAMSSLIYSLDAGGDRPSLGLLWSSLSSNMVFLDNCCSIKLIHNDGRLERSPLASSCLSCKSICFSSWSNKINVTFHMKEPPKKESSCLLRNIVLPVIPDESTRMDQLRALAEYCVLLPLFSPKFEISLASKWSL